MYTPLFAFISSIHPLSPQIEEALSGFLHKETLPKKTLLLKEGNICNKVYFIEKGIARAFYYKQEQEITAWFMQEHDLILSVFSFFKQKPSYESIELLEDTTLYSISYSHLQHMYKQFPEFNFFGRVLTENYYVKSEERIISLRMLSSQERYNALLGAYPHIFNRVPLKHIASYLGMTPETLSRLRAKIK
jgi:CRP-like cAMP-binding protein